VTTADKRAEQSGLDQIAGLLFGVAERTRRAFEAAAASFDLTPARARALLTLEQPAPMRSLADLLHCDASNVTGIADRLEAAIADASPIMTDLDAGERETLRALLSKATRGMGRTAGCGPDARPPS
jgi:hypothetical protein